MASITLPRRDTTSAQPLRLVPPSSSRSRPPMLVGILLIAGFALAFVLSALHLDHRPSVLVVSRAVPAGGVIQAGDLSMARLSASPALHPIPAVELNQIIGRPAAVALVAGTLLTNAQLGTTAELQKDQSLVGVSLKAGQFPPSLTQGARVQIIDTGLNGNGGSLLADGAVVTSVGSAASNDPTAATVVGLKVSAESAAGVTAASAAGQVGLVQEPQVP